MRIYLLLLLATVIESGTARAATLYELQTEVVGGFAGDEPFVFGSALQAGTTWVRASRGVFTNVRWRLYGEKEVFYWDNFCGRDPDCFNLGHIVDTLDGDYTITPTAPIITGYWVNMKFIHPNLAKIDFFREPDFDVCSGPPFQGDCSRKYRIDVEIDFTVAAADGPIHFGIYNYLSPVPEPVTWLTLTVGFGLAGAAVRRRRLPAAA